ncbi:MAG TPA: hypothetical protein VFB68_02690 [Xanthobacteraceae bacterium]|nr:hypothetical protein [Xanthobacteraceae bacterium]
MTAMRHEPDPPPPGRDINPFTSMLMKIVGTLMLVPTGLALCFIIFLAVVDPPILGSWVVQDPFVLGCYLLAAAGVGLILYARYRDRIFVQDHREQRRRA